MDQRQQILEQSEALFMRYGLKSVTMDDIARELGISKKTLYRFVENKADLIGQIFTEHIEREKAEMSRILKESDNAIDEILQIARYVIQQLREMSPTVLYDLQKYYRESWNLMEAMHNQYIYQVIKTNLERGIGEGVFRTTLNPDIVAKLYVGKNSLVVDEDIFPLKKYNKENLFREYIHYHIHGIASPKGLELLEKLGRRSEVPGFSSSLTPET